MLQLLFLFLLFCNALSANVESLPLKASIPSELTVVDPLYNETLEVLIRSVVDSQDLPAKVVKAPLYIKERLEFKYWSAMYTLQAGRLDEALGTLQTLQSHKSYYSSYIRHNIALIQFHQGHTEAAVKTLLSSNTTLTKDDGFLLASLYLAEHKIEEAKDALLSIQDTTKCKRMSCLLAKIYYREGEVNQAVQELEQGAFVFTLRSDRIAATYLSQLYLEQGRGEEALGLMKNVVSNLDSQDPYTSYIDSYLFSAQKAGETTEQIRAFILEQTKTITDESVHRVLQFTLAKLVTEHEARLSILAKILQTSSKDEIGREACYAMMKIASSLKDNSKSIQWLQKCVEYSTESSLTAKALSELAEKQSGKSKIEYYKQALKKAKLEQISVLRLNYNLSQFEQKGHHAPQLLLSVDQQAHLLLEKAFSSSPTQSLPYYERFFELNLPHEDKGIAHLKLAQILLEKGDDKSIGRAKAHLKEAESRSIGLGHMRSEFLLTKAKVAIYEQSLEGVRHVLRQRIKDVDLLMELGKSLYNKGYYHEAAITFRRLSGRVTDLELSVLSLYFQAASHYKAREMREFESLTPRIKEAIDSQKSLLKNELLTLLAYYYLSQGESDLVLDLLDKRKLTPVTKMIKAQALIRLGDQKSYDRAEVVLSDFIEDTSLSNFERYKVAYKYILLLEEQNKLGEMLDLYYQVIYSEIIPLPNNEHSWKVFNRIVMRCFDLLEGNNKCRTLYNLAKTLALKESPYRKVYQDKADQISLKYVLWDLN